MSNTYKEYNTNKTDQKGDDRKGSIILVDRDDIILFTRVSSRIPTEERASNINLICLSTWDIASK